jgi:hypothetical protein
MTQHGIRAFRAIFSASMKRPPVSPVARPQPHLNQEGRTGVPASKVWHDGLYGFSYPLIYLGGAYFALHWQSLKGFHALAWFRRRRGQVGDHPKRHTPMSKTAGFAPFKPAPRLEKVVNLSPKSLGFYPRYGPAPKTHPTEQNLRFCSTPELNGFGLLRRPGGGLLPAWLRRRSAGALRHLGRFIRCPIASLERLPQVNTIVNFWAYNLRSAVHFNISTNEPLHVAHVFPSLLRESSLVK